MQIDWLTTAAQIVNFLILVWLLQHFLYRPITRAMRRREERIEERLVEARKTREEAEEEAERLTAERRELDERRQKMLEEAREEAEGLQRELEAELREEMKGKRETWQRNLQAEREEFFRRVRRRAGTTLLDITGRVLADFADEDLSDRIATRFLERLDTLDTDRRKQLSDAAAQADHVIVSTGRTIGSSSRGKITRVLHETLGTDIEVNYREDEKLLLGVRLTIAEQTVEWSAGRHLDRLEQALNEIVDAEAHGPATSAADSGGKDTDAPEIEAPAT
ncbi:hypothetical protein DQW77_13165 [Roseovarius sp. TE539]|uniref:F0F1 ATP synthase subunit delta n=1 Tax=Roseovarius sp. TE539 TaxID=2249812 RepID=UPI000DDC8B24|nr:F0F1 ATP synthase subunit delta [Roseovarius sp. TE539]RBI70897.1 hypothetical protein DQW77_13165 [Roseovarius sp. TE539]